MNGRELTDFERWLIAVAATQRQRRLSMINHEAIRAAMSLQAFGEQMVAFGAGMHPSELLSKNKRSRKAGET